MAISCACTLLFAAEGSEYSTTRRGEKAQRTSTFVPSLPPAPHTSYPNSHAPSNVNRERRVEQRGYLLPGGTIPALDYSNMNTIADVVLPDFNNTGKWNGKLVVYVVPKMKQNTLFLLGKTLKATAGSESVNP